MAGGETVVHLAPALFGEKERKLVEHRGLAVSSFRYDSGVAALRVANGRGELVMLPFQGQQIWSARFDGRDLGMKSMIREPLPTQEYLRTYGCFLLHCGATAMGVPGPGDKHPLHGDLPNANYQSAWLVLGEDARGPYVGVSGAYEHIVAFNDHYVAEPMVRLYEGAARLPVSITIRNLKRSPMDLMYLAHINFRPVDNGRLLYSAPCTPEHVRVRRSIPPHIRPPAGYVEFLEELAEHPERHHVLAPGLAFDPEVVFLIDYRADAAGWAHSLQVHPDGTADYVAHRPEQLGVGVRWISRTADQDALGFCMPATAGPEGYTAEKARGLVRTLAAGAEVRFDMEAGLLSQQEAAEIAAAIEAGR